MLSSVVVILVSSTFLVQNQYYASKTLQASAHDNARVSTERMASELRSAMAGGFVVAGSRTLTVRSPIRLSSLCDRSGNQFYVHLDGGVAGLDTDELAGVALRNASTGAWTYRTATWGGIDGGSGVAAQECAAAGADTTGAGAEFRTLFLQSLFAPPPSGGELLMLYRQTTFRIQQSVLEPASLGLFRQIYGQSPVELATGMDATARFQYRTGGTTYADTVAAASLGAIDAVRLVAEARKPAETATQQDAIFGWSVNVALRNAP